MYLGTGGVGKHGAASRTPVSPPPGRIRQRRLPPSDSWVAAPSGGKGWGRGSDLGGVRRTEYRAKAYAVAVGVHDVSFVTTFQIFLSQVTEMKFRDESNDIR